MSPGRSFGASRRATQVTKRVALAVCQPVCSVSHRSARIAPIIVKLFPQFIGRGSTITVPRGTHACDRPIARFAPDSSTKTSRAGSTCAAHWRNASRLAWTSGRSCSAGRGRFFKHVSRPSQRAQHTRSMDPVCPRDPPVVHARQVLGGGIRRLPDDCVQHREHHGRGPPAPFAEGRHGPGRPPPLDPAQQRPEVHGESIRYRRIRRAAGLVRPHRPFTQFDGIGIGHAPTRSYFYWHFKWILGLER